MASNYPPTPPPGGPPSGFPMAPPPPPKKKISPWLWALFGCLGLVLLIGVAIAVVGGWAVYKVKQDPAGTMARLVTAGHPNLEVLSSDGNVIKFRDKQTGKTLTLNMADVKEGKIVLEGEDGERISLDGSGAGSLRIQTKDEQATIGGGGEAKLPSWFPSYPGATPESKFALSDASSDSAGFEFTVSDPAERVIEFYETGLKQAGLEVSTQPMDNGAVVHGKDSRHEATVTITSTAAGVTVDGTVATQR